MAKGLSCSFIGGKSADITWVYAIKTYPEQEEWKYDITESPELGVQATSSRAPTKESSPVACTLSIVSAAYPPKLSNIRLPGPPAQTLMSSTSALAGIGIVDFFMDTTSKPPAKSAKSKTSACYTCADKKGTNRSHISTLTDPDRYLTEQLLASTSQVPLRVFDARKGL